MRQEHAPLHEGLLELGDDGPRLVGGDCGACARPHFPLGPACPYCGSADVARRLLSPTGTVWGHTAVRAAPPGYEGPVPFGFGVVELPEGLRVITRLTEADPHALTYGQAVQLVVDVVEVDGEPRTTYAFAPIGEVGP